MRWLVEKFFKINKRGQDNYSAPESMSLPAINTKTHIKCNQKKSHANIMGHFFTNQKHQDN